MRHPVKEDITEINLSASFHLLNVAIWKFELTYAVRFIFLLDNFAMNSPPKQPQWSSSICADGHQVPFQLQSEDHMCFWLFWTSPLGHFMNFSWFVRSNLDSLPLICLSPTYLNVPRTPLPQRCYTPGFEVGGRGDKQLPSHKGWGMEPP